MRISFLAAGATAIMLSGCVVYSDGTTASFGAPKAAQLSRSLTPEEVAWSRGRGSNTVSGQALMRTRGGDVKTCAGLEAQLIPYTAYAQERIAFSFGAGREGFARPTTQTFDPDPAVYGETIRQTVCDAQGGFAFYNVPDGRYFVLVNVSWGAVSGGYYPYVAEQGGLLMGQVEVRGGETTRLILSA